MIQACRVIVLGEKHKGNKQFPAAFTSIYERFKANTSFWYQMNRLLLLLLNAIFLLAWQRLTLVSVLTICKSYLCPHKGAETHTFQELQEFVGKCLFRVSWFLNPRIHFQVSRLLLTK